jgi:hypothetical protein
LISFPCFGSKVKITTAQQEVEDAARKRGEKILETMRADISSLDSDPAKNTGSFRLFGREDEQDS